MADFMDDIRRLLKNLKSSIFGIFNFALDLSEANFFGEILILSKNIVSSWYLRPKPWPGKKNFENRTIFSKVMCGIAIGYFFLRHPVHTMESPKNNDY